MVRGVMLVVFGCACAVGLGPNKVFEFTLPTLVDFWAEPAWCGYLVGVMILAAAAQGVNMLYTDLIERGKSPPYANKVLPVTFALSSALIGTQSVVQAKCLSECLEQALAHSVNIFGYWYFWITLFLFGSLVAVWLFRLTEALRLFEPLFIIPMLQVRRLNPPRALQSSKHCDDARGGCPLAPLAARPDLQFPKHCHRPSLLCSPSSHVSARDARPRSLLRSLLCSLPTLPPYTPSLRSSAPSRSAPSPVPDPLARVHHLCPPPSAARPLASPAPCCEQSNYILFATISGGIYFQEFNDMEPYQWVGFCVGICIMFVGLYLLAPEDILDADLPEKSTTPGLGGMYNAAAAEGARSSRRDSRGNGTLASPRARTVPTGDAGRGVGEPAMVVSGVVMSDGGSGRSGVLSGRSDSPNPPRPVLQSKTRI